MVVVEGATLAIFVTGPTTMLVMGVLLNIVGLGIFCWTLFAVATYALPFFVGMTVGIHSFQAGADPFGAIVVGFVTAGFTLVVGQYAFSIARSPIVRLVTGLLFAVPAARAGYDVTLAVATLVFPRNGGGSRSPCLAPLLSGAPPGRMCHDADQHRSETGRCTQPYSATERGDDHEWMTIHVCSPLGWHDAEIWSPWPITPPRSSRSLRSSRMISSADCNPVVTGTGAVSCLLGNNGAAFLHARLPFRSPATRGFLCEPIARWHVS